MSSDNFRIFKATLCNFFCNFFYLKQLQNYVNVAVSLIGRIVSRS